MERLAKAQECVESLKRKQQQACRLITSLETRLATQQRQLEDEAVHFLRLRFQAYVMWNPIHASKWIQFSSIVANPVVAESSSSTGPPASENGLTTFRTFPQPQATSAIPNASELGTIESIWPGISNLK